MSPGDLSGRSLPVRRVDERDGGDGSLGTATREPWVPGREVLDVEVIGPLADSIPFEVEVINDR